MRIITIDDFIDVYLKIIQRGGTFILSKLNPNGLARTKSAFSDSAIQSSNWWIIPVIRERWNEKITGNKAVEYEEYTVNKYLQGRKNLRMLSIGSGICSHELKFAQYNNFQEIICMDIADNLLQKAQKIAQQQQLENIQFLVQNIYKADFPPAEFDLILFHSSLHHFSNIENLLSNKVKNWLRPVSYTHLTLPTTPYV